MCADRTSEPPCEIAQQNFHSLLSDIASAHKLRIEELLRRVLLQLPRLSDAELQDRRIVASEIERVASHLEKAKSEHKDLLRTPHKSLSLGELSLKIVPEHLARTINQSFHYIGYHRPKSINIGLFTDDKKDSGVPVSMVTLSPFDLGHVERFLPGNISSKQVLVASRVFGFDWAPENCISFMMGQTFKWTRQNMPHTKLLLTYLNPNACFSGTSYKASNWILFGWERGLRYAYLDGNYVTLRTLRKMFHTADVHSLRALLGDRLELSVQPLAPLELYAYFLDRRLRREWQGPVEFHKEPPIA